MPDDCSPSPSVGKNHVIAHLRVNALLGESLPQLMDYSDHRASLESVQHQIYCDSMNAKSVCSADQFSRFLSI